MRELSKDLYEYNLKRLSSHIPVIIVILLEILPVIVWLVSSHANMQIFSKIFINQTKNKLAVVGKTKTPNPPAGMVYIPSGWFWMGCSPKDKQCDDDEKPYHKVYLSQYFIDKNDVTVGEYTQCLLAGVCTVTDIREGCNYNRPDRANYPINCVTWDQANTYCQWVGKRLPTEAEWEKAARGTDGRIYPWGNKWDCTKCCNSVKPCKHNGTCQVGSYPQCASPYKVMDMVGNVANWTRDWYDEYYYKKSHLNNPQGPDSGMQFVIRGGSWSVCITHNLRTSERNWVVPLRSSRGIGFRCVKSVF